MIETSESGATFSQCGRYRYDLWRRWGDRPATMVVIGLNPSTADGRRDDPTVRRCIGFAKREGCDGLVMLNLFALRSTDPRILLTHREPVGPGNDAALKKRLNLLPSIFVAAWGNHRAARHRAGAVTRLRKTSGLWCLGVTKSGAPRHPLYVRADMPLVTWSALDDCLARCTEAGATRTSIPVSVGIPASKGRPSIARGGAKRNP